MALLDEGKLQAMERVHARVLADIPNDIVALTMVDAVETIRAAWRKCDRWRQSATAQAALTVTVVRERDDAIEKLRRLRAVLGSNLPPDAAEVEGR